jgi:hypothetical protein
MTGFGVGLGDSQQQQQQKQEPTDPTDWVLANQFRVHSNENDYDNSRK